MVGSNPSSMEENGAFFESNSDFILTIHVSLLYFVRFVVDRIAFFIIRH